MARSSIPWRSALAVAALGAAGYGLWSLNADDRMTAETGGFLRDSEAGFVVTQFAYVLGADAVGTESCPSGPTKNVVEIFSETPEGARLPGESDEQYSDRLEAGGRALSSTEDGRAYCEFPELAAHDPNTQVMLDPTVLIEGIDLDGEVSRSPDDIRSEHIDFNSPDGTRGVDNQFWRAFGCNRSFQEQGLSNGFVEGIYAGEWGILISLSGVDDLENDEDVEVTIAASADPLMVSPSRQALDFGTYALDPNPAFRAITVGQISDGVLVSEPVDVLFHSVTGGMHLQRSLRDARIRASISPDGTLQGFLAGYSPVVEMYDNQFAYRNAKESDGSPTPFERRLSRANGAARVLGHTCQGVWQSLHRLADGDPDENGRFTSISTQYRFEARPAFVVERSEDELAEAADG